MHIARCHSWRQSLRQYPRQRNPNMLAPQSGQNRLRVAEINLMPVFPTTVNVYISPLLWRFFTAECTEPLSRGRRCVLGRALIGYGLRPLASDAKVGANESPNAFAQNERSHLTANGQPPGGQSCHLELRSGLVRTKHPPGLPYCKRSNGGSSAKGKACWRVNLAYTGVSVREVTK